MEQVPEKILVVDDDRNLLDSFKRQYRKRLNLVTSTSGADALQALADDGPFAVLITDMQMPNMDGIQLLGHECIPACTCCFHIMALPTTRYFPLKKAAHMNCRLAVTYSSIWLPICTLPALSKFMMTTLSTCSRAIFGPPSTPIGK